MQLLGRAADDAARLRTTRMAVQREGGKGRRRGAPARASTIAMGGPLEVRCQCKGDTPSEGVTARKCPPACYSSGTAK
eukprot:1303845-Alexandrium_andersonii.AAC.1